MILYHIHDVDERSAKRLRVELEEANIGYEYPYKKSSEDESYSFSPKSRARVIKDRAALLLGVAKSRETDAGSDKDSH